VLVDRNESNASDLSEHIFIIYTKIIYNILNYFKNSFNAAPEKSKRGKGKARGKKFKELSICCFQCTQVGHYKNECNIFKNYFSEHILTRILTGRFWLKKVVGHHQRTKGSL
jgi:hypothetical protein